MIDFENMDYIVVDPHWIQILDPYHPLYGSGSNADPDPGGKSYQKVKKTVLGNIRSVFCVFTRFVVLWIRIRMDPELSPGSGIIVLDPDPANIKEEINKIKKILG